MRPYQRKLAVWISDDVLRNDPPISYDDASSRYIDRLGEPRPFNTKSEWKGDIREAALWTLIHHGFAKFGAVKANQNKFHDWVRDEATLATAAALEIEFGSNTGHLNLAPKIGPETVIFGEGPKCVYVYVDSRLYALGDKAAKIGRHDRSGQGEVIGRILQQYRTGNPGYPVLKYIFRTFNATSLEKHLHNKFRENQVHDGIGKEWFEVDLREICDAALEFLEV